MTGYRFLSAGERVLCTYVVPAQDGYPARAGRVVAFPEPAS